MLRHSFASLALALAFLIHPAPAARAADAPSGSAVRKASDRPAIVHPDLDSLVGSWDVTVDVGGQKLTGTSRWWKALRGTALLEDFSVGHVRGAKRYQVDLVLRCTVTGKGSGEAARGRVSLELVRLVLDRNGIARLQRLTPPQPPAQGEPQRSAA